MKPIRYFIAIALAVPVLAFAQANTPRVDQRQANQLRRIDQGVATGRLTPREARHLQHGQRRVARMERRAKADGVVTRRERARLRAAQNRQDQRIYALKHNHRSNYRRSARMDWYRG